MEMRNQPHNPADLPRGKQKTFKFNYSEPGWMCKAVVAWSQVLFWHLSGETED